MGRIQCFKLRRMVAEGQNTASASRTKLLENGRDSETSTGRESSTDVE